MDNATKIRLLRIAKNLKQSELARQTGVPVNYISAIESGAIDQYEEQLLKALGYQPAMDAMLASLAGAVPAGEPA